MFHGCLKSLMHQITELELDDGAAGYRISNPPMMLVVPLQAFLEVRTRIANILSFIDD